MTGEQKAPPRQRGIASLFPQADRVTDLFLAALTMVLVLFGCGYHVAGHNTALPKTVHVIAVPAMENATTTYRVEQKLTAATIHELLAKTNYRVVSNADSGDAVLLGKVLSMEVVPLLFQTTTVPATTPGGLPTSTAQATAMLVTMKCQITLTEKATGRLLYHSDDFVFRNEYQLASCATGGCTPIAVKSFFQEGDPALDRMAQDFAGRLVSAVLENY